MPSTHGRHSSRHADTNGSVIVDEPRARSRSMRRRVQRAADTRARIRHPNVVPARTVEVVEGRVRLGLEQHRAPTLAERLAEGPLDPQEAADLVDGLAAGYHSLAAAGLSAHRFTPDSVRLDPTHGGILADSGVPPELLRGEWLESDPDLVFRSPEELRRQPVNARSAVYSLGALLYTALTGEPPYVGAPSELYASHFAGPRPRPTACRPELPREIDAVVARAMAVHPGDRYGAPADLAEAVAAALGAAPTSESGAAAQPTEAMAATRRDSSARTSLPRPWLLAGVLAIGCALLGGLLARTSADDTAEAPERIGAAGLSVRPPSGWERAPAGREVPFPLRPRLAARPARGSEAGMDLATLPSRTDLEPLFAYAGGDFLAREPVRLGPLNAWRYTGLRAGPDGAATAYVAPTTRGLLVLVCHAGGAGLRLLRECTRAAGTVRFEGARPASLATLDDGGERLKQVVVTLGARRSRGRDRLAAAELARGQAEAARALSSSYAGAAAAVTRRTPLEPVGSFDELSASLRRTAAAYASLATAAKRSAQGGYRTAVSAVGRAERAVVRALAKARVRRR